MTCQDHCALSNKIIKGIISDDHVGLKQAREGVFGGILWQRVGFTSSKMPGPTSPATQRRRKWQTERTYPSFED